MSKMTVCVTGGAGYIGSWIVKVLLDNDYNVHATVRDKNSPDVQYLTAHNLSPGSKGSLTIYEADLLVDGSFDAAMAGCDAVIHTASPFIISKASSNPEEQLIKPAVQGTKNVLSSVNRTQSVKHVIVTSSYAAVSSFPLANGAIVTEQNWDTDANIQNAPYHYSKRLAEQAAWEIYKTQNRWTMSVINPGFVLGPTLGSRINDGSIGIMIDLFRGKYIFCFDLSLLVVDVRDVAKAHLLALENFSIANGKRYLCFEKVMTVYDIGQVLRTQYPESWRLPKYKVPKPVIFFMTPVLPVSWYLLKRSVDIEYKASHAQIIKDLGMRFTDVNTTILEMAADLINKKVILRV